MTKNLSLLLTLLLFSICLSVNGQTIAVTENGDTIYVYNNGTWSFEILDQMPVVNEFSFLETELPIDTITTEFLVSKNAKKQIKNAHDIFTIKYNDKLWQRLPPANLNDEAEFAFKSRKQDIWCVVISEETPIEADKLLRIAKKNMEDNTGGEVQIVKTELRKVNGQEVVRGVLKANFSGISFTFDTYYFSNEKGSVQFTTWTSDQVWERSKAEISELLNGLIAGDS